MPTIESSEKRQRQEKKRRERNQRRKSRARTATKRFEEALEEGNLEEARELLRTAESEWDRAVSKDVFPENRASRRVAKMKRQLAEAEADDE